MSEVSSEGSLLPSLELSILIGDIMTRRTTHGELPICHRRRHTASAPLVAGGGLYQFLFLDAGHPPWRGQRRDRPCACLCGPHLLAPTAVRPVVSPDAVASRLHGQAGRSRLGWPLSSRAAGAPVVDGGLDLCGAARRQAGGVRRRVAPYHTRGRPRAASPRPRLCVCGAPLHASPGHAAPVGACARGDGGGWPGALAPGPGGWCGPATAAAAHRTACLA